MDTIAPAVTAPPAELLHRRIRLELGPGAAAHACGHVRAAISAWSVPVSPAAAILLTSDLVINAVTNGAGETVTLGIRWSSGQFRVEVHDASVSGDSWEAGEADADADRGLRLAAAMAADWGHYRTPAGRAVYYVLAPEPRAAVTSRGDDPPSVRTAATTGDAPPNPPKTSPREDAASLSPGTGRGLPPREPVGGDGEP